MDWTGMLKSSIHAGIKPSEFYEMTIAELALVIEVYGEKQKQEIENTVQTAIINAYYTVALDRSKKLPPLSKLLNSKNKKVSTDEEMFKTIKNINAMFGGGMVENK